MDAAPKVRNKNGGAMFCCAAKGPRRSVGRGGGDTTTPRTERTPLALSPKVVEPPMTRHASTAPAPSQARQRPVARAQRAKLRASLEREGLGALRRLAVQSGASQSQVSVRVKKILDGEETRAQLIDMIIESRASDVPRLPPPSQQKTAFLKPSELRKRAQLAGVDALTISSYLDQEISKEQFSAIIVAQEMEGTGVPSSPPWRLSTTTS